MKKILGIGFVLVALIATAVWAFFGGAFESAPTISSTPVASVAAENWEPPASSGRQAAEAAKAAEEAAKSSSGDAGGSCVPNFFRGDGMSPIFWIVFGIWAMAQLIPTKIDDVVLYGGLLVMTLLSFVGKGCLGDYNPFSPWWWLLVTIWVIFGVSALKKRLANRHWALRWGLIALIWLLLGVFS